MKFASALALSVVALCGAPAAADPVVVELFTSQGCSSCPPADDLLGELAAREDVIPLSLHVDYWDWIGWKDTFADPAFSDRQRAYAAAAGSTVVYTPQFVVGGDQQIGGAKGMKLADAIRSRADAPDMLSVEAGRLRLAAASQPNLRLFLVEVTPRADVQILRGENAGRDMTYHHIVRAWTDLGAWDGSPGLIDLPAAGTPDTLRIILAQQVGPDGHLGAILGAVRAD